MVFCDSADRRLQVRKDLTTETRVETGRQVQLFMTIMLPKRLELH